MINKKRFLTFGLVGIVNTTFGYSLFLLFFKFFEFHYQLSIVLVFIFGTFFGYFMHLKFTYKDSFNIKKKFKYFVVNLLFLVYNMFMLYIFKSFTELDLSYAQLIILGIRYPLSYIVTTIFVFKKEENGKKYVSRN